MKVLGQYGDSEIAYIIQFTHQRWQCTKQPSWHSSTNICQTIYSLVQKLDGRLLAIWRLRIANQSHSHIKDSHTLNSHLGILQPTSSKLYIFLSRNWMTGFRQWVRICKTHPIHTNKDDHALHNHLGILQPTSSSKLYVLLSRNLIKGFLEHGDSGKIIAFAYQRLPSTKQPSWISSTNIFF